MEEGKKYFSCEVIFIGINNQGNDSKQKDIYLIQAETYTVAEARVHQLIEEGKIEAGREYSIGKINPQTYIDRIGETFDDNRNYECKMLIGYEKPKVEAFIVNARSVTALLSQLPDFFREWVVDTEIDSIKKTKFVDVFNLED